MSRDSKVHGLGDDDEGKYALVDISSEDDAEVSEIGVDLEFHVQCLMDLIPSVQQNITHVEKSRLKDGWSKDQSDPEEPGALIANEGRFFKSPNLAMIAHVNNRDNRISSYVLSCLILPLNYGKLFKRQPASQNVCLGAQ